jgi:hypothetical protein
VNNNKSDREHEPIRKAAVQGLVNDRIEDCHAVCMASKTSARNPEITVTGRSLDTSSIAGRIRFLSARTVYVYRDLRSEDTNRGRSKIANKDYTGYVPSPAGKELICVNPFLRWHVQACG